MISTSTNPAAPPIMMGRPTTLVGASAVFSATGTIRRWLLEDDALPLASITCRRSLSIAPSGSSPGATVAMSCWSNPPSRSLVSSEARSTCCRSGSGSISAPSPSSNEGSIASSPGVSGNGAGAAEVRDLGADATGSSSVKGIISSMLSLLTGARRRDAEDSPAVLRMPDPAKFRFDPDRLAEGAMSSWSSSSSGAISSSNSVSLIDDRMVRVGSRLDSSDISALSPAISECWRFHSSPPCSSNQRARTAESSSADWKRSSGLLAIILSTIATRSLGRHDAFL
jgi:hypothetical protein